jgi:WD40 repeat protein
MCFQIALVAPRNSRQWSHRMRRLPSPGKYVLWMLVTMIAGTQPMRAAAQPAKAKNADGAPANEPVKAAKPAVGRGAAPLVPPLASFLAHSPMATFVLFSPDGKRLISGGSDKLIQVWEMQTGKLERTLLGHASAVKCGALSADGKTLVTGSTDRTVRVWDVDSGATQKTLRAHADSVDSIALAPDAKTIASGGRDRVFLLWNIDGRAPSFHSPEQELPVNRIAFSPDGKLLATGAGDVSQWREPGDVKLWNAATGDEAGDLFGHAACVNAVVFSPDGSLVAVGTAEGMLRIWDVATRTEFSATNFGRGVRTIAFLADDRTLAIGQWPGRVFLWDRTTKKSVVAYAGHDDSEAMVDVVAVSPDGSLIASTGTDGMIYLWPVPATAVDGGRRFWKPPGDGKPTSADLVRQWAGVKESVAPASGAEPKK